ncbi:hypothetical protein [Vibrio gallaecicus]|uniref:hypothetical protein n=1 Tax=Vibrio gallaecicus TaxID=552386 RepID=UPI0025B3CF75|nr:hypothetical protein [Vibrio gallaecicus]MDN3614667.1 hypothetical protein [Vibrio gallaecicus]MDN3615704.1 hypothetical protein [Vibrio gallaecicus]MDN3615880.1 hypothetical protein [Vibrio gallaecicus]
MTRCVDSCVSLLLVNAFFRTMSLFYLSLHSPESLISCQLFSQMLLLLEQALPV